MLQCTKAQGIFRLNQSGLLGTLFWGLTFVTLEHVIQELPALISSFHWPQEVQSSGFVCMRPYNSNQAISAQKHSVGELEDSMVIFLLVGKDRRHNF